MNLYLVGNLLMVSSERGKVHVFRLGSGQEGGQGSVKAAGGASASSGSTGEGSSPPESVDEATQRLDGGCFVCSLFFLSFFVIYRLCPLTDTLRRFLVVYHEGSPPRSAIINTFHERVSTPGQPKTRFDYVVVHRSMAKLTFIDTS